MRPDDHQRAAVPSSGAAADDTAATHDEWDQALDDGLHGLDAPPEVADGLQPRRSILTSQNGSSLSFVRPRREPR
jgi:hypothetical protein